MSARHREDTTYHLPLPDRSSGSELFICNCKCYKKLQRFEKAKKSFDSIKQEICSTYQAINRRVKRQRADQIVDGNIAPSKRTSVAKSLKFNPVPASATSTTSHLATLALLIIAQPFFSEILWHGHLHNTLVINC